MAVSTRELFILGAVSRNPIHGHGINRIIEISGADQWVELGEKHVYYVLRKLEAAGLIVSHEERAGGAPPRNVYAITRRGRRALRSWFQSPELAEAFPPQPFDTVFGMLGFAAALDEAESLDVLRARRRAVAARLDLHDPAFVPELRRRHGATSAQMLLRIHGLLTAELAWLDNVIQEVETTGWDAFRVPADVLEPAPRPAAEPT